MAILQNKNSKPQVSDRVSEIRGLAVFTEFI
jgi:hypothetical protein